MITGQLAALAEILNMPKKNTSVAPTPKNNENK